MEKVHKTHFWKDLFSNHFEKILFKIMASGEVKIKSRKAKRWWTFSFERTGKIQQITLLESTMKGGHTQGEIRKVFTSLKHRPTLSLPDNFPCTREHQEANAFLMCSSVFNYTGKVHFQSPFILNMTLSTCAVDCRDAKKTLIKKSM